MRLPINKRGLHFYVCKPPTSRGLILATAAAALWFCRARHMAKQEHIASILKRQTIRPHIGPSKTLLLRRFQLTFPAACDNGSRKEGDDKAVDDGPIIVCCCHLLLLYDIIWSKGGNSMDSDNVTVVACPFSMAGEIKRCHELCFLFDHDQKTCLIRTYLLEAINREDK